MQWQNGKAQCLDFTNFKRNVDTNCSYSNSIGNYADFGRCIIWFHFSSDSMSKMNHKTVGRSTLSKEPCTIFNDPHILDKQSHIFTQLLHETELIFLIICPMKLHEFSM
jgi:hypothetical protein